MNALPNCGEERAIIQHKIDKLFSDVLNVQVPSATTDLFETGILDSQKFVELLLHLEEQFDTHIDIADLEFDNFRCLEKIATLFLRRKGSRAVNTSSNLEA
jgi:acyl carrier protein